MASLLKETKSEIKDSQHRGMDYQTISRLSDQSFGTFCDDISGMFGVNVRCNQQPVVIETFKGLNKYFTDLAIVHCVKAQGASEPIFHLMLDRSGLFVLAGVISMHTEELVLKDITSGSLEDARAMSSILTEVGEALVGAWDRVFRKELQGHSQFVQTDTFIGNPWSESEQISSFGDGELVLVSYEMAIEPYPAFKCGVIFLKELFAVLPETELKNDGEKAKPQGIDVEKVSTVNPGAKEDIKDAEKIVTATVETDESKSEPIPETIRKLVQTVTPPLPVWAKDIMQKDVIWCGAEDSVEQASAKMQQYNTSYILVGQNGALEGIVSKSDIKGATSSYLRPEFAKWRRPLDYATLQIKLKWVMSKPVHTVKEDTLLAEMIENMSQFAVRCLPVVNNQGKVEGIVTVFDIFRTMSKKEPK